MTQQATAPTGALADGVRREAVASPESRQPGRHIRLGSLRNGRSARVLGVSDALPPAVRRRLHDLGVVVGTEVVCLRRAPLGSPVVYRIGESDLCLRRALADAVLVVER